MVLYFHHSEDLHRVSSERTFMDFSLSGFIFSSLRGFIPCLLTKNFHGFCPQWLYIFIPQRICTVSPQRELWRIFPLVALSFASLRGFIPYLLRENLHGFCPQTLYIFIPQRIYTVSSERTFTDFALSGLYIFIPKRIYTVSPKKEPSRILPSMALHFHPLEDLYRVSSKRTIADFAFSGFIFSSLSRFTPCLLRENFHGFYH